MEIEYIVIAFIIAVAAFFLFKEDETPATSELTSSSFKISNQRYKYEYELEKNEISINGILTEISPSQGIKSAGVETVLHYLTSESLTTFKRTQDTRTCNAPFFNAHAKHKQLIPENAMFATELATSLASFKSANYTQTATWRPFNLKGYCIKKASLVEVDGKNASLPRNMFDNCLTMVVTQLNLIDQSVMAGY